MSENRVPTATPPMRLSRPGSLLAEKSDVYIAAAAHELVRDSQAKVLAMYPARALIQDQIEKWKGFVEELRIKVGYIDGVVPIEYRGEVE